MLMYVAVEKNRKVQVANSKNQIATQEMLIVVIIAFL